MTIVQSGRYSKYIMPISLLIDLLVINILCLFFFRELMLNTQYFIVYQTLAWLIIAYFVKFYDVFRYTNPISISTKIFKQALIFILVVIAFFPFFKNLKFNFYLIFNFVLTSIFFISSFKYLLFYYLKQYRISTGSNFRNIVIIGYTSQSIKLKNLFEERNDFGYRFLGYFSEKKNKNVTGNIEDLKTFILENQVDEIFCSLNEMTNDELLDFIDFADDNNKLLKFIPDTNEIFSKRLKVDYYAIFPVLSIQKTILHEPIVKIFKRFFDISFSIIIIIFLLSWLVPLLAVLIKLESSGPIFFKQGRPGLDQKQFSCYKFRSMRINITTEQEASKNDPRVTRIGKFIRKTSIDEMPQFLNVLKGEMSVVGPRPHLWSQNKSYGNKIKKYMMRHYVKPGITGLAQVKGYRGEIETDEDMINRINYDVFYIENWSIILDIKIIGQTVVNIFKGEEKAY